MEPIIASMVDWEFSDWTLAGLEVLLWIVSAVWTAGILYLIFLDTGSTLRRQERARCFLHLLEIGLKQGQNIEHTILSLARSRVNALGVNLHLIAAHLDAGLSFNAALEKVPGFLPAQVRAMLCVGDEIGNIPKVIPACRNTLRDGFSGTQTSLNNLMVVLFVSPIGAVLVWICAIWILPRFRDIIHDFELSVPPWTEQMFGVSLVLSVAVIVLWLIFCLIGIIHAGGPSFVSWLEKGLWSASHRINYLLPWRRKRMQRDFSVILSLLLDSGVPEEKSVGLAAASAANKVFIARAGRVIRDLEAGVKLPDALRWLDDAGEFQWRLRNASQAVNSVPVSPPGQPPAIPGSRAGFFVALAGWHESLEARAFHQEQAVSQISTTGLVLLNGLMVGLVALGLFRFLLAMLDEALLW